MWKKLLDELNELVSSQSTLQDSPSMSGCSISSLTIELTTPFDAQLKFPSDTFCKSKVPKSCEEARKYLQDLGQGYKKIYVCKNSCVLFRGTHEDRDTCPKCKESRWQDADGSGMFLIRF